MKYIKPILFTLLILTAVLCGYIYYKFDARFAETNAYSAFKENNFAKAGSYLSALSKKNNPKYHLYHGYLLLEQKKYDEANTSFKKALHLCSTGDLNLEISGALSLTLFFSDDIQNLDTILDQYTSFDSVNRLFEGLLHYQKSNYKKAKEHLKDLPLSFCENCWLQTVIDHNFSKEKLTYYLTHCMIESGETYKARQQIESFLESTKVKGTSFYYLIGLSYLKEERGKSLSTAIPYYQTAFQYFKQILPSDVDYSKYKNEATVHYTKLIEEILDERAYQELGIFLDILGYFDAKVAEIADLFFSHLQKEVEIKNKARLMELACQTLAYCHNSTFKEKLSISLYFYVQNLVKNHQVDSVKKAWPIYNQISSDCSEEQATLTKSVCEELEKELDNSELNLENSQELLELLGTLSLSYEQKVDLLESLTPKIEQLWITSGENAWLFSKSLDQLIFSDGEVDFHKKMNHVLKQLHSQTGIEETSFSDSLKEANEYFQSPANKE